MDSESLVGQQIDTYLVKEHLARGGMADVYLAFEAGLRRDVVLKMLLPEFSGHVELAARFRREAQATAALNHPNIIQIYSTGTTRDGRPYLAMQYVQGGSLHDKLVDLDRKGRLMPVPEVLSIVQQIAGALSAAHQRGIIHRDLKPSNILLHTDGRPILTDLGIAVITTATRLTRTGAILGTPHYMAPEQASGGDVDERSDIYSLGVIFYELLTGQVPFDADSALAILHQHVYSPPPPIEQVRSDLPPALHRIVHRCLEKDPDRRFQTASELSQALDQSLVQGSNSLASPTPFGPNTQRAPSIPLYRRLPIWVYGLAAVAILILLILFLRSPGEGIATPSPSPVIVEAVESTAEQVVIVTETTTVVQPTQTLRPTATHTPRPTNTPVQIQLPDRIAFQSDRDGDFDIYIMNLDGSGQTSLTSNSVNDQYPTASPDGRRLAFQSNRDGNYEIYVMDVDGNNQRRLTHSAGSDRLPTWSADSQQIAFLSDRDGDYDVYVINADGSGLRQVTNNSLRMGHISWAPSPEMTLNAGTTDERTWEIYVMGAFGGNFRPLTSNNLSDWSPEWSPDGQRILYLSVVGNDDPAIFIMNADGSDQRMLFNSPDYEWGADWSADGNHIVFTRDRNDLAYIYLMDSDGTNARLITDRGSYPTWVRGQTIIQGTTTDGTTGESEQLVSESGVPACDLEAGEFVHAGPNARIWTAPDVRTGQSWPDVPENTLLTVTGGPNWGRIRRDVDVSGWWWEVVTPIDLGFDGWVWQNRIVECEGLPEQ